MKKGRGQFLIDSGAGRLSFGLGLENLGLAFVVISMLFISKRLASTKRTQQADVAQG